MSFMSTSFTPVQRLSAAVGAAATAAALLAGPASAANDSQLTADNQQGLRAAAANPCAGLSGGHSNPSKPDVSRYIDAMSRRQGVPPQLLKVLAFKENGWEQFLDGRPDVSFDGGIGMLQLTGDTARAFDVPRLCLDWRYNLESGAAVLRGKLSTVEGYVSGLALDRTLIENWVQAARKYNGGGARADAYAVETVKFLRDPAAAASWLPTYTKGIGVSAPWDVYTPYAWPTIMSAKADGTFRFYRNDRVIATQRATPHPWTTTKPVVTDDRGLSTVKYGKTVWIYGQSGDGLVRRSYDPKTGRFGGSWKKFAGSTASSSPDAATWTKDGTLEVVAASKDPGKLHRRTRKNGKWLRQSAMTLPTDLQYAPSLVSLGQGKWRLFYVDIDGRLWNNAYANKRWGKWNPLGGGFVGAAQTVARNGQLTVFVPRGKRLIRKKTLNLGTGRWTGWSGLRTPFTLARGSSIGATYRPNGQIVLAARGSDKRLYKTTRTSRGWKPFTSLRSTGATNLGGAPEVTAPDNASLLIVGRTTEGIPSYTRWTRRGWTTWKTIG